MRKYFFIVLLLVAGMAQANAKGFGLFCYLDNAEKHIYEDEYVRLVIGVNNTQTSIVLAIFNKTDNVIFVDRESSFAYLNDNPTTLFGNTAQKTSTTDTHGATVNLGSVAGAMGVSGSVGTLLSGVNVGGSTGMTNTTITYEKRVIAIAPKAVSALYEWVDCITMLDAQNVITGGSTGTGSFKNPGGSKEKFKAGVMRHYTQAQSPLRYKGVVKYSSNESFTDAKLVTTENYLKDIIVDSKNGITKGTDFAPYTSAYNSQPCIKRLYGTANYWSTMAWTILGAAGGSALFTLLVFALF